ncbi:MAG TPA: NADH-quinone oxidoreductase subunit N, partial [Bacteroidetes bacterium]|nr:NADH-quinone oxidoreductase subunit N [Bacteroidota bacterium]
MDFFSTSELLGTSPILMLSLFSLIAMLANALLKNSANAVFGVSIVGIIASIACCIYTFPYFDDSNLPQTAFSDMLLIGGLPSFFGILFLLIALFSIFIAKPYLEKEEYHYGEYYVLILIATIGMLILGAAADLITVFLGIEIMSVSFYVLAGYYRNKLSSNESALKYFLLGAFATGFLLYGIALIYGTTGT